jgi:hypothetical protein
MPGSGAGSGQFGRGRLARRLRSDAFSTITASIQNMPAAKTLRAAGAVKMNSSNPRNAPNIASQIASTGGGRLPGSAIHRAASIHRAIGRVYAPAEAAKCDLRLT